jgi:hypothetical protein
MEAVVEVEALEGSVAVIEYKISNEKEMGTFKKKYYSIVHQQDHTFLWCTSIKYPSLADQKFTLL